MGSPILTGSGQDHKTVISFLVYGEVAILATMDTNGDYYRRVADYPTHTPYKITMVGSGTVPYGAEIGRRVYPFTSDPLPPPPARRGKGGYPNPLSFGLVQERKTPCGKLIFAERGSYAILRLF